MMDPKECLYQIISADPKHAPDYVIWEALEAWLVGGGFKPPCYSLGREDIEIGGNGFDGPRRPSTRPRSVIWGPNGWRIRSWGNHYAMVTNKKTHHFPI